MRTLVLLSLAVTLACQSPLTIEYDSDTSRIDSETASIQDTETESGPPLCKDRDTGSDTETIGIDCGLAAGRSHFCGVICMGGGNARCWGDNTRGQLKVPPGINLHGLVAHDDYTCGFENIEYTADDRLHCWGTNDYFSDLKLMSNFNFESIALGNSHLCGKKENGQVFCYGDNSQNQTAVPDDVLFSQISAGNDHTCGLTINDNRIVCWGADDFGQSTLSVDNTDGKWRVDVPNENWKKVSAGDNITCGIKVDGFLYCWGDESSISFDDLPATNVGDIVIHYNRACVLYDTNPNLECWGVLDAQSFFVPDVETLRNSFSVVLGECQACATTIPGHILSCW